MAIERTHYVTNAKLIPELEKYKEDGKMSDELVNMLVLICKNYANIPRFINYTWKEDMVQEALLTCCKYLKNFDTEKSRNPFGYISKICEHSFHNYCNKQRKHSEIKDRCFNNKEFIMDDDSFLYSNKAIDYTNMSQYTKRDSFSEEFEEE